jgi:hypothetical protein
VRGLTITIRPLTRLATLATPSPLCGEREKKESYAASARAPFSAGVMAPDVLISATSLAE